MKYLFWLLIFGVLGIIAEESVEKEENKYQTKSDFKKELENNKRDYIDQAILRVENKIKERSKSGYNEWVECVYDGATASAMVIHFRQRNGLKVIDKLESICDHEGYPTSDEFHVITLCW